MMLFVALFVLAAVPVRGQPTGESKLAASPDLVLPVAPPASSLARSMKSAEGIRRGLAYSGVPAQSRAMKARKASGPSSKAAKMGESDSESVKKPVTPSLDARAAARNASTASDTDSSAGSRSQTVASSRGSPGETTDDGPEVSKASGVGRQLDLEGEDSDSQDQVEKLLDPVVQVVIKFVGELGEALSSDEVVRKIVSGLDARDSSKRGLKEDESGGQGKAESDVDGGSSKKATARLGSEKDLALIRSLLEKLLSDE